MRLKIRCDGESWKILQNFWQLNRAQATRINKEFRPSRWCLGFSTTNSKNRLLNFGGDKLTKPNFWNMSFQTFWANKQETSKMLNHFIGLVTYGTGSQAQGSGRPHLARRLTIKHQLFTATVRKTCIAAVSSFFRTRFQGTNLIDPKKYVLYADLQE
jgi:hypothetical protein